MNTPTTPTDIRRAKVEAAERVAIAGIPQSLLDNMAQANAVFREKGGCPGCKSQAIGVHSGGCPELLKYID